MPNRRASRNAYYFFVLEKMPELRRRGLPVTRVADAIPFCSSDWGLLREEEKEKYAEMAREWKATQGKAPSPPGKQKSVPTTFLESVNQLSPVQTQNVSLPDVSSLSLKSDQAVLGSFFYFLNIFSHGELPPHCEQRFLPCEIGCIKYSLQEGIVAEFHRFIDPGEVPRGFRFHCQAASDASHKIPISNFHSGDDYATVLQNLYRFISPNQSSWPPVYCKSDDRYRVNWCLKHMAKKLEIRHELEILTVEDLVVGIYQQKLHKEPSKTWVRSLLDVSMWDYSSNTRCKWHEKNDILFCALAVCKKIASLSREKLALSIILEKGKHLLAIGRSLKTSCQQVMGIMDCGGFRELVPFLFAEQYCISNSLGTLFGIPLTEAHVPLQDYEASNSVNPKMVVLDAGRFQKLRVDSPPFSNSSHQEQRSNTSTCDYPSGVKTAGKTSNVRGRGITRLLESISNSSGSFQKLSNCETPLSPYVPQKDECKSFSSFS